MKATAIVTTPFRGVKDGEIYPTDFKVGDVLEGSLAVVALEQKWAAPPKPGAPAQPQAKTTAAPAAPPAASAKAAPVPPREN